MITSISVKNFKSIINSTSNLPRIGAIVGQNGAGKTNLVQAINLVRKLVLGINVISAIDKISLIIPEIYNYNESSLDIYFELNVENLDETKYILEFSISSTESQNSPRIYIKSESLKKIRNEEIQTIYTRENNILKNGEGSVIPLAVDETKAAISLYQNADVTIAKKIFDNVVIPEQYTIDSKSSIVGDEDLGTAGLLVKLRQKDPVNYEQFQTIIKKLLPMFSSIVELPATQNKEDSSTQKSYAVLLTEKNLKGMLSMYSVSAGDLRTLYLIACAMYMNKGSTLIIEEIENGLHPKRLQLLLEHLDNIARVKNMQILYTTHSPTVIDRLRPEEILYVYKDSSKGTLFNQLSCHDNISDIENMLREGVSLTQYLETKNPYKGI